MTSNRQAMNTTNDHDEKDLHQQLQQLQADLDMAERHDRELRRYIRDKTDQLLKVMGTLPLEPQGLDDDTLIHVDPIGIVTESFKQVLEHLQETNADLSLAKEELQAIFDSAGAGILVVDRQMRLLAYNRKSQELFLNGTEDVIGEDFRPIICGPEDSPEICIFDEVIARQIVVEQSDFTAQNRHYHVIGTPIKNAAGEITHVILVYADISERKLNEQRLQESESRFRALFLTMQEGVAHHRMLYDDTGLAYDYEILDINPAYEKILGLSRKQVINQRASQIYPLVDGNPACLDVYSRVIESQEPANFEFEFKELDRIFQISAAPLGAKQFATVFEDITERKQNVERIEKLAYFDALTGLPNRILMRDRLSQMVARSKRNNDKIGLFFLDLDHFKRVNDTLGHDTGDQLLIIVAKRLNSVLRNCDTICRLGGDEFVILIEDIKNRDSAATLACKIHESLTKQIVLKGKEVFTSTSIGIALYPDDGDDPDTLLKNADTAMYRAKDEGRNTYFFYSSDMNSKALEQLLLANDLRKALEKEEFYLVYQPQIDLEHGQITGVEALLRWDHTDLGNIPPAQFIPLAEETGLILTIGQWVLESACEQAAKLQQQSGLPLRVAVNLSAKQFRDPNLVLSVKNALDKAGLNASSLELEITESILMDNIENAQNTLHELKSMGIKLAIDDFGTGYSSLSYLRNFPIDRLKIDKTFIQRITTHPDDAAIAEAIIVMAHILGNRVVAEGVEQQSELDFLREKQCDEVQGFYFSRPKNAEILSKQLLQLGPEQKFCLFNS